MTSINVRASSSYDVIIGSGLLDSAGDYISRFCKTGRAAVITDDIVDRLYYGKLQSAFSKSSVSAVKYVIKNGERSKNAENYIGILNFLAQNQFTRSDTVIALGGGVVGDLAGFAASTYLRGVGLIQIPTTLLAMVDSSVGGKTAIDLECGKNLAGTFYQPRLVLCDCDALDTLGGDTFADGCAEVIKYAVLGSEELFLHLAERGKAFERERVISACVKMKRDIVCEDEFDNGTRQLLNLGHTLGHAIELCSGYTVTHGSAVAAGTAAISQSAARSGICSEDCALRIRELIEKFSLPSRTGFGAQELYNAMLSDKKRRGGVITLVVPEKIGRCVLRPTKIDELRAFIEPGLDGGAE